MLTHTRGRLLAALTLTTLAAQMSGCLGWEIRNELRQANASLDDVKIKLNSVNDGLLKLERTNTVLSDLDMKLASLETTNATLSSIDTDLAAIRRALGSMKITMPGLEQEGGESQTQPEPEPEPTPQKGDKPG